jgi:hypothetical protein
VVLVQAMLCLLVESQTRGNHNRAKITCFLFGQPLRLEPANEWPLFAGSLNLSDHCLLFNDIFVWNVFVCSPLIVDHLIEVSPGGRGQNSLAGWRQRAFANFVKNSKVWAYAPKPDMGV